MTRLQEIVLDASLIFVGTGLSVLFVSSDGNGPNPIAVAGQMSMGAGIIGVVSFTLARVVRSGLFAVVATIIIIELLFILLAFRAVASSSDAAGMLYLLPEVLVVSTFPMVVLASIGFVRLASSLYQRKLKRAEDVPQDYDHAA